MEMAERKARGGQQGRGGRGDGRQKRRGLAILRENAQGAMAVAEGARRRDATFCLAE